jgi:hypothetical protein
MRARLRQGCGALPSRSAGLPAAAPQARRLVGEVVVAHGRRNNNLAEGAGDLVPLKRKGYFRGFPHRPASTDKSSFPPLI